MDFISQICEKYDGEYIKEKKSSNTPKGKVEFQSERARFKIGSNQYEILAIFHGGILQGTDQIKIILSIENSKKKVLRIYPRSIFDKLIDLG